MSEHGRIIKLRKVFGFNQDVKDCIAFYESDKLFYLSGQIGVIHNLKTLSQTFLPIFDNRIITAMCLGKDNLLIMAFQGHPPKITVINLQTEEKKKLLCADKVVSEQYISVSFSSDHERVGAQGGAPDWAFVLWRWKTKKLETVFHPFRMTLQAQVYTFAFCPNDSTRVVAVGHQFLRFYQYKNELRIHESIMHEEERSGIAFQSVAWTNELWQVLVGNSIGEILIFDKSILLRKVSAAEMLKGNEKATEFLGREVRCIISTAKGQIYSSVGDCVICYEGDFEIQKILKIPSSSKKSEIVQLISNFTQDILVVVTKDGRIFTCNYSSLPQEIGLEYHFTLFQDYQHTDDVICADTAMLGSLYATCSSNVVILRNFCNGTVHQRHELHSTPKCISLHPLCINILIGYSDGFEVYNILQDKIVKVYHFEDIEFSLVCFSPAGNMLVIFCQNIITIRNSTTFSILAELKNFGREIKTVLWRDDHNFLVAENNAILHEWSVLKREKVWSYRIKDVVISAIALFQKFTYVATTDCKIMKFSDRNMDDISTIVPSVVTAMIVWNDSIIASVQDGTIVVMNTQLDRIFLRKRCHMGYIIHIGVSCNSDAIVFLERNGVMSTWTPTNNENISGPSSLEVNLVDIKDQSFMVQKIAEMEKELHIRQEAANRGRLEQKTAHKSELQKTTQNYKEIKDSLKNTIESLSAELREIRAEREKLQQEKVKNIEQEMTESEDRFQRKMADEKECQARATAEKEKVEEQFERQIAEKKADKESSTASFKERHERQIKRLQNLEETLSQEYERQRKASEEYSAYLTELKKQEMPDATTRTISDTEQEVQLQDERQQASSELKETRHRLVKEKEQVRYVDNELDEERNYYQRRKEEEEDIKVQVEQVEKDIERLEKLCEEKNILNNLLQYDIMELKAGGDLRLKELENELEVKSTELINVKIELEKTREVFKEVSKKLKEISQDARELLERLTLTEKRVQETNEKLQRADLLLERYRAEFLAHTTDYASPYELRRAIIGLYEKRVLFTRFKEEDVHVDDANPIFRFFRQRDHYESLINTVQYRAEQIRGTFRDSYVKLAQENSDWRAFAESLRDDVRREQERIKCLEEALGLKEHEFASNPMETQRRLHKAAEMFQRQEEEEKNEVQKILDLITCQETEIRRLHALLTVEESNKIVRK